MRREALRRQEPQKESNQQKEGARSGRRELRKTAESSGTGLLEDERCAEKREQAGGMC